MFAGNMLARRRQIVSAALVAPALALFAALGARAEASASSTPAAPACAPAVPDTSSLLDGAVTVSPMPGARDAPPHTQISFLGVAATAISAVTVVGSAS